MYKNKSLNKLMDSSNLEIRNLAKQLADTMHDLEIEKATPAVQLYHCDGERIIKWLDNPKRKDARIAFTDGLERQVAYRFEDIISKNERLREALFKIDEVSLGKIEKIAVNALYYSEYPLPADDSPQARRIKRKLEKCGN